MVHVALWRMQRFVLTVFLALSLMSGGAWAQLNQTQEEYVANWLATAERAEQAVETARASNAALEALRDEIVDYRRTFEDARDQNSARIETLKSQIAALGPPPEEGQEEPAEIAVLRDGLNKRVEALRVPVVVAHEAYFRANGIITEIDRIIRERQTRRLLSRAPSPAMPTYWPLAWRDVRDSVLDIAHETALSWQNRVKLKQITNALPQVFLLVAAGLLFLIRGRVWSERLGNYLRGFGGRGSGIWRSVVSLGKILFPLIGVYLITQGIGASKVLGLRGGLILDSVPQWAATVLGFMWLAERLYPRHDEDSRNKMPADIRASARKALYWFAVVLVLKDAASLFERIQASSDTVLGVIGLPIIVLGALALMRLRSVLNRAERARLADEAASSHRVGLMRAGPFLRQAALLVALATPLMAVAGYGALAEAILFPFMLSIGLFGVVVVLQWFFTDLYVWVTRTQDATEDLVLPVLIGFALTLGAVPLAALIWGARMADLTELWERFLIGVSIGDTRISPVDFLTFAVVFAIGYTLTRLVQNALKTNLLPKTKLDAGGQTAIVSGLGYVGIFLAALIAVSTAGIDLSSLAIVAGALSVGIGFGLQTIVSNFVSGIILLIERPVAEGDWIEVGGYQGYVRDISVRSTRIETFDRSDVIVPNSELVSGTVVNYTRGNTIGRLIVPVGVAYGTDTGKVEQILKEIASAHPMVLTTPPPTVVFQGFGADSLDFEIRAILRDVNWVLSVKSEINHQINARFAEEGIEIPFAQRDVWLRNPEALREPAGGQTPPAPAAPVPPELQDIPSDAGNIDDD